MVLLLLTFFIWLYKEIVEETMQSVPLMKEIVDAYSGPDRVTAKEQQGELERVAKTLPQSAPNSVKQFTNRAVLSLQVSEATLMTYYSELCFRNENRKKKF